MQKPLELTFRHMDPSPAMEAEVRERVEGLERFCADIIGCSVVIEAPHKHHEEASRARVTELWPEMDYGRMLTPDGRDIYFHRNSIVNGSFDELEIGTELRFEEEAGDEGPQASSAHIVGRS